MPTHAVYNLLEISKRKTMMATVIPDTLEKSSDREAGKLSILMDFLLSSANVKTVLHNPQGAGRLSVELATEAQSIYEDLCVKGE
jgi:hypothetical protein